MSDKFLEFDRVLDGESWEWLQDNAPTIADQVERMVGKGVSPEEIKRRVLERSGAHRFPFAQRCESAARWLRGNCRPMPRQLRRAFASASFNYLTTPPRLVAT